ncbi:hypothetical protein [Hyphomicrobium sp. 802]|uniref:hypothetical protein n=1 Tax=Hyphomicrobium sp. 802 TaxID=1112272 RepID=UPI00045E85CD|nr:hypothetical protein [Hyphomicrobium sp. 802]
MVEVVQADTATAIGDTAAFERLLELYRNGKPLRGVLSEVLDSCATDLERFRIASAGEPDFDDRVVESIGALLPSRNRLIELFGAVARYDDTPEARELVQRFLEKLLPYMNASPRATSYNELDFDNFRFFAHETFLSLIAVLLQKEKFDFAAYLLNARYYSETRGGIIAESFSAAFCDPARALLVRDSRLKLGRASLQADILIERAKGSLEPKHLIQADLTLFIRGCFDRLRSGQQWMALLSPFMSRYQTSCEIYARSESKNYFERVKSLFAIKDKSEFQAVFDGITERRLAGLGNGYYFASSRELIGFDKICTRP